MPNEENPFYLPKLDSYGFDRPKEAGHWHNAAPKVLGGISEGIKPTESDSERGISSVPSVWARPLLFKNALFASGGDHPLHDRALQEWRGLMSLLALHDKRSYDLDVVGVNFDRSSNILTRALRKLAPSAVQLENDRAYAWTDVLLIRYNGIPLGAFSPATLVYTASDYASRLKEERNAGFRLADADGYLQEPKGPENQEARWHLRHWLEELKEDRLSFYRGEDRPPEVNMLTQLLNDWVGELPAEAGSAQGTSPAPLPTKEEPVEVTGRSEALNRYRIYEELLKPLEKSLSGFAEKHSDLVLATERNSSDHRDVIVITEELLSREYRYRIWDDNTIRDLGGDAETALREHFPGASGTQSIADWRPLSHEESDAMWIRPERYFLTDTLVESEGEALLSEAGDGARANFGTRFVPPLKKEILHFYSPNYIRSELKPEWQVEQGRVTFAFELPLANGVAVRVEKTYRRDEPEAGEGIIETMPAPVLDLFPDYMGPHWRTYYLFEGAPERVHVEPVFPPLPSEAARSDAPRDSETRLHGWQWQESETTRTSKTHSRRIDGRDHQVKLTEMTGDEHSFPEGLVLSEESRTSRLRDATPEPYGLILISRQDQSYNPTGTLRVGVDLGTSNTNVYTRSGSDVNALNIDFHGRHIRPVTAADGEARQTLLNEFFVPDETIEFPVPTGVRIFDTTEREHLLLDYFIYFSTAFTYPDVVYTDVKWSGQKEKIQCFIRSLLFLILIDALDKEKHGGNPKQHVEIAYSYPKSFTGRQKEVVRNQWKKARQYMTKGANRVFDSPDGTTITVSMEPPQAEGRAAGEYFKDDEALDAHIQANDFDKRDLLQDADRVAVCIDVGGGTTDLSIWNRGKPICDASVLLAGGQIAEAIRSNPQIREVLFPKGAVGALNEVQASRENFSARLNAALKLKADHVKQELGANADSEALRWLRQMIGVEFAALAFYAAYLLGGAAKQPGGEGLLENVGRNGIQLYWGGNGARLLNWLDYGRVRADGHAESLLQGTLKVALHDLGIEQQHDPSMVRSPSFKHEPSGGLVVMDLDGTQQASGGESSASGGTNVPDTLLEEENNEGNDARSSSEGDGEQRFIDLDVVSGEEVHLRGGDTLAPTDTLTDRLFDEENAVFEKTTLDRLSRFLQIVNALGEDSGLFTADKKIELDSNARRYITGGAEEAFRKAKAASQTKRVVEPVFISEIKHLMGQLT